MKRIILVSALALGLGACSTVAEINRPDPVDLSQFHPGQHRLDVVKVLGPPLASVSDGPQICEFYHLYTHGPGGLGKAGIAFTEGVADVFTLGIAEVVSTPVEAATKNSLYPVTMCYDGGGTLLSVEESSTTVNASAAPPPPPIPPAGTATAPAMAPPQGM